MKPFRKACSLSLSFARAGDTLLCFARGMGFMRCGSPSLSLSLPPAADRQRLSPCSPAASRYPRQCHGPRGRGAAGLEALLRDLSWPSSLQNSTASFKETERTLLFAMVLNYATAWKSRRINGREAREAQGAFFQNGSSHFCWSSAFFLHGRHLSKIPRLRPTNRRSTSDNS